MAESLILARKYEYRRRLPHYQKADRAIFVTFRKFNRDPFSAQARDVVLQHCVLEDGKRITLHAAVVMPDHVHLLLTPSSRRQRLALRFACNPEANQRSVGEKCEQPVGKLWASLAGRVV